MRILHSPNPAGCQQFSTAELRATFLIDTLFTPCRVELVYSDADRMIVGSALPSHSPVKLSPDAEMRAAYFCERRELGILNVGAEGGIEVDGKAYPMAKLDCLYAGRGTRNIVFSSRSATDPAAFLLLSCPAHAEYPTTHARMRDAALVELGTAAEASRRTIYKYIHPDGIKSCQLVMGFTKLHEGSVWNTMPPHTHARRSEIYFYFDLDSKHRVMHFMGAPQETRHLVVADRQAVISPSWSIHSGCGTGPYSFCWAMGGENQAFDDMDAVKAADLR